MTMHHEPTAEDAKFIKEQGFREPNYPYVLFKRRYVELLAPDKKPGHNEQPGDYRGLRPYEALVMLNVAGCHCQPDKIENRYLKLKNARIVSWGNFPDDSSDPAERARARMMADSNGMSPWKKLAAFLTRKVAGVTAENEKVSQLDAKVARLEKELLESKKGKKQNDATI